MFKDCPNDNTSATTVNMNIIYGFCVKSVSVESLLIYEQKIESTIAAPMPDYVHIRFMYPSQGPYY